MKTLSIALRVVALLAAAFCIFTWWDTRQQISYAVDKMSGVEGESLQDKADKIPALISQSEERQRRNDALSQILKNLESKMAAVNSELEGERAKNLKSSAELSKQASEIRSLNQTVAANKKSLAERDKTIESLKAEVLKTKSMVTQDTEVDSLKEKIAALETQLEAKQRQFLEADKKAKILDMSEIVEVIETNAEGQKIRKKIVKVPYIPQGDIATVLSVDQDNQLVEINRGHKNGVKLDQVILLRRDGEDVSEIKISEVFADKSVGMINRFVAIPETIEKGDSLEMCNPAIEELQKKANEAAPANGDSAPQSDEASAPSAPSAPQAPADNAAAPQAA